MRGRAETQPLTDRAAALRALALIAIVLSCLGMSGDGSPRLSFWHPPHQISEGERIEIRVRVPRDPENRKLTLDALDREFGESVLHTERQIDPGEAPLQVFRLILPVGDLLLVSALYGVEPKPLATVTTPVRVRGKYESAEER